MSTYPQNVGPMDVPPPLDSADTPRPERVTLTDEPAFITSVRRAPNGTVEHSPITRPQGKREFSAQFLHEFDNYLAAREQALREEIAQQIEDETLTDCNAPADQAHNRAISAAYAIARGEAQ